MPAPVTACAKKGGRQSRPASVTGPDTESSGVEEPESLQEICDIRNAQTGGLIVAAACIPVPVISLRDLAAAV